MVEVLDGAGGVVDLLDWKVAWAVNVAIDCRPRASAGVVQRTSSQDGSVNPADVVQRSQ